MAFWARNFFFVFFFYQQHLQLGNAKERASPQFQSIAAARNISASQLLFAFVTQSGPHPGVRFSIIDGTASERHMHDNLFAVNGGVPTLTAAEREKLLQVF